MTAEEIAETLLNGNWSAARRAVLEHDDGRQRKSFDAAMRALDVVEELANLLDNGDRSIIGAWTEAHARVRRCLEGSA